MNVHIEGGLYSESFMSIGSIVDGNTSISTGCVGVSFSESWLKDFVFGIIFGVEASLSASVIAETKVFDFG